MNDNTMYVSIWTFVLSVLVVIVGCVTYYNTEQNRLIADMVKSGTPAIEAACAFSTSSLQTSCIVLRHTK